MFLSVGRAVVVLLEILENSQLTTVMLCTGTRAGQHYECCAEHSEVDVPLGLKRNLRFRFEVPPAVEAVDKVMIAALDIDRVSATTGNQVAQYVGVAGLLASDVLQELLLLHLLNRQPDGPVVTVFVLQEIFLLIEVFVRIFPSSILRIKNNYNQSESESVNNQ